MLSGIVGRAWWLPAGLLAVGLLAVLVGRVWGRHRLAAAGSWWELRLGERVSRPALEAFARTLAGGLPGRCLVRGRGSPCRCPPRRIGLRAACSSRVAWPRRRCGRRSSRPSAASRSRLPAEPCRKLAAVCACGLRVSWRWARGFSRCAWITASTRPGSSWLHCARRRPERAVSFSLCCKPRRGRRARKRAGRPRGCAQAAGFSRACAAG